MNVGALLLILKKYKELGVVAQPLIPALGRQKY
jgi:hypothetical protein